MASFLSLVLTFVNTIFRGFLIKVFWGWFVVSQFHSLPEISLLPAIGFSMFVGAIAPWKTLTQRDLDDAEAGDRTALSLLNGGLYFAAIVISLGVGWVIHALM